MDERLLEAVEHAGTGSLVSDLAASERFYRAVLSVLGVEPSHVVNHNRG